MVFKKLFINKLVDEPENSEKDSVLKFLIVKEGRSGKVHYIWGQALYN